MMADIATVEYYCEVNDAERALLTSHEKPILLLGLLIIALLGGAIWAFLRPGAEVTPSAATTQPSQATLFPEAATQPASISPSVETPAVPATQALEAVPSGSDSSQAPPTPLSATLTPWPTNTSAP